ncbi:FAD-dependent oxidoreductase [Ramlibacter sp. WS9]|uniref:FAD-dependent oxidoreductase n=1 Tax=Ramlibacter sp. WS9 TaxID=1882741 RepID=UPI0013052118|nr:FAD-dependent oxidoreductase [Ramlibacter sp. WS9]
MRAEFLVVGSGLSGATIARMLADAGRDVLVLERRPHVGGNVHDHVHPSGIRVHTYGPHYFRTNDADLWTFVNRFSRFHPFEAVVKSQVEGGLENWPIAASYIRREIGTEWEPGFRGKPANFEEASLALMPRVIYEAFVKGYTEKQWGCAATALSATLARRFDVREDDEPRLMRHKYQGIPHEGYAHFMENLLDGIPLLKDVDYLQDREAFRAGRCVVFTGPIDEYFGFDLGRLGYRGQRREHQYLPDVDWAQPCGQVNNPGLASGAHIRTLEWKYMMPLEEAARLRGTVLTREFPFTPENPGEFEYPFPDAANAMLYEAYRQRAEAIPQLLVCGRLGEYRYYDMDQAIARAMLHGKRLMKGLGGGYGPNVGV